MSQYTKYTKYTKILAPENLMRFNPNPSVLAQLSDQQQQKLLSWLELRSTSEVLKMVAAEPPDGFGIHTHPNSLKRFYARHRLSVLAENSSTAIDILKVAPSAEMVDQATAIGLRQVAFELTNSPRVGVKQFKALSRWVLKLRDQDHNAQTLALARERLALERQKFEFDAAREALLHYSELAKILRDATTNEQSKVDAARLRIFGNANVDSSNPNLSSIDETCSPAQDGNLKETN